MTFLGTVTTAEHFGSVRNQKTQKPKSESELFYLSARTNR